jgi:hypothetical protein
MENGSIFLVCRNFDFLTTNGSCNSSAVITIVYELGGLGFDFQPEEESFLFSSTSRPTLGPQDPLIQWIPGTLSPRV